MAASGASGLYVNPNTGAAQAGLAPFRNAIINGDMRINQRGTSTDLASLTTVTTATPWSWVADRWKILRGNVGSGGVMAQGTNLTISDLPFNDVGIKTFGRIGRLSGNTSVNSINIHYSIESQDCYRFVGKPIVFSFYYRTGANFSGTAISSSVYTGTAIDQSLTTGVTGIVTTAGANCNPNTSWQKISYTGLIGTNINQIHVEFYYIPTGTAAGADHFDITGVQLELGSVATPFEVRPYPVELQMCQRYCQVYSRQLGFGIPGPLILIQITPVVQFRSIPSFSLKSTTIYFESTPWSTAGSITNATILGAHMTQFGGDIAISATFSPGLANNSPYLVGDIISQYLTASSEL